MLPTFTTGHRFLRLHVLFNNRPHDAPAENNIIYLFILFI